MGNKSLGQLIDAFGPVGIALFAAAILAADVRAQSRLQAAGRESVTLRLDSAEVLHRARDLQAKFEFRRRRMLPRFYIGTADHCLIVGRFCEWHPNLQDSLIPDEGSGIRRARAELLRELEKASSTLPGDDWIVGQRLRYLVESHDTAAVGVARACRATKWWCEALLGLALHVNGNFAGADSAFSVALADMPPLTRCYW
ncbi:MAG TPA: hypothetical protein VD771_07160, partial [Gemmatimonadaceae bacterium]|nr:hypothetical protein [Gemmatimonadaceae bacterium]